MYKKAQNLFLIFINFILSSFYERRIRYKYRNLLHGEDCFILGSARCPDISLYKTKMKIVTVNGSGANSFNLGLSPITLTIVDNELLDPDINITKESRKFIIENKILKNINLGKLFSVQSNLSIGGNPEILESQYSNFEILNKFICKIISKKVTNTNLINSNIHNLPSTGFFAMAICFWLGAKSVTLAGFSFYTSSIPNFSNYFYLNQNDDIKLNYLDTRSHSLADSMLLGLLIQNGYNIFSKEKDLLPLLSNWGQNPPENIKKISRRIKKYKFF